MSLRGGDPAEIGGYPLEARLGSGGMGTVFLARTASGRPVAIKLIHQQFAGDEEFRIRFRQEVVAARRVSGAFTAAVVDADPEAEHPWMATAYIEGHTLAQRIAKQGPLAGAELRTLAIGLTEALRDIHRAGVVHRDLKPSNVVLSSEGPRVIDFGISRAADQQTLTMTGRVIGTPPFMSPEQLQAPRGVGPRSDVFSLGTLLVYAATGQGPFDADSPYMTAYQVVHEAPELAAVPAALRAVVEPCLAKDPDARPSADQLLERLRDLPGELGAAGAAPGSRTRDTNTRHHHPADGDTGGGSDGSGDEPAPMVEKPDGTFIGRGLRRRLRPVLAAAVAVATIGGGVAWLQLDGPDAPTDDGKEPVVAAAGTPLPDGFRSWRRTVSNGLDTRDELRCVPRGDDLFCGGGGIIATRMRISDGKELWKVKSHGVPVEGMHMVGVADGAVIAYRPPTDEGGATAAPTEIVALDADTSKELWSTESGSRSTGLTGRTQDAVLRGSTVLTVNAEGTRIEAREARSGDTLWSTPMPAGSECAPFKAADRIYAMCAPHAEVENFELKHPVVRDIDPESGALGKGVALRGPVQPMGEADGSLVFLHERTRGTEMLGYDQVLRVSPRSGKVTTADLDKTYQATPGMAGGTIYFTDLTGRTSAIDPATGRRKWFRQTGADNASGPVMADGVLYFSSSRGRVAALSPRKGKILWTADLLANGLNGSVNASPRVAVSGRVLVVAAADNMVAAFDVKKPPKP